MVEEILVSLWLMISKYVNSMEWIGNSYNPSATPKGGYFFSLWGFLVLMGIVLTVIMIPALVLLSDDKMAMYAGLLLQGFVLFALPAWLVETYYRRSHMEEVWRLRTQDVVPRNIAPMLLLLISTLAGVAALTSAMEVLPVPALFEELERATTEQYEQIMTEREPMKRILIWLGTVVAAPFGEELFFRGALMGWLLTKMKNKHVAIWIVALVFSAVHMQWTGFPGRLLIGGMLGYVAIYGGLWMAILFHFLNNLLALLLPDIDKVDGIWWVILIALPAIVLVLRYMKSVAAQNKATTENKDIV